MKTIRVQIRKNGSITLPKEVLDGLDVGPGSYLKLTLEKTHITLEKMDFDPFAEVRKKPDPDAFEKIRKRQEEGLAEAEKEFLERMKDPPEIRPEDRPDFWD